MLLYIILSLNWSRHYSEKPSQAFRLLHIIFKAATNYVQIANYLTCITVELGLKWGVSSGGYKIIFIPLIVFRNDFINVW